MNKSVKSFLYYESTFTYRQCYSIIYDIIYDLFYSNVGSEGYIVTVHA